MKKILLLLTILSSFSYSKNIKGDFSYNFNVTNNYDYNVKATFDSKERKWLYNPKYVYNKYNSSYQLANINGSINSSLGLYLKYTLESPIKLDEFDQKEAVSGDTIKLKKNPKKKKKKKKVSLSLPEEKTEEKEIEKNALAFSDEDKDGKEEMKVSFPKDLNESKGNNKRYRSSLNPNLTQKPNFNITLGYQKTFFLNDNVTINNHTSIKYLVSTFKGLENLEEKQLDINENFTVYNKYVNVGLNMNYSSINLINPIEYKLGFSLDKNIYDSNFKLKFDINHKLEENIAKNKIIDIISYLDTTPHEHSGEKTSFYVQERLEGHQRRRNRTEFGEHFKSIYLIPELTLEYSKKLNRNLFLNAQNNLKYSVLRYSGYTKGHDNEEKYKYISKLDLLENDAKLNLRYSDKRLTNVSELGLKYTRSLHNNNYTKEFDKSGIDFINFINEKKRNYQELNLSISNKVLYDLSLTDKLTLTPRLYAQYQGTKKYFIFTPEEKIENSKNIKEFDDKINKFMEEIKESEEEDDKKTFEKEIKKTNDNKQKLLDSLYFNFNHNIIIEPGIVLDYEVNKNLNVYTSIDIPFIFKTRKEKNLGIKPQKFDLNDFQKIPQENVFLPNNYNVKFNLGLKYSF